MAAAENAQALRILRRLRQFKEFASVDEERFFDLLASTNARGVLFKQKMLASLLQRSGHMRAKALLEQRRLDLQDETARNVTAKEAEARQDAFNGAFFAAAVNDVVAVNPAFDPNEHPGFSDTAAAQLGKGTMVPLLGVLAPAERAQRPPVKSSGPPKAQRPAAAPQQAARAAKVPAAPKPSAADVAALLPLQTHKPDPVALGDALQHAVEPLEMEIVRLRTENARLEAALKVASAGSAQLDDEAELEAGATPARVRWLKAQLLQASRRNAELEGLVQFSDALRLDVRDLLDALQRALAAIRADKRHALPPQHETALEAVRAQGRHLEHALGAPNADRWELAASSRDGARARLLDIEARLEPELRGLAAFFAPQLLTREPGGPSKSLSG